MSMQVCVCVSVLELEQKLCACTAIDLKGQLFESVYLLSLISLPSMPVSHCISEEEKKTQKTCLLSSGAKKKLSAC